MIKNSGKSETQKSKFLGSLSIFYQKLLLKKNKIDGTLTLP